MLWVEADSFYFRLLLWPGFVKLIWKKGRMNMIFSNFDFKFVFLSFFTINFHVWFGFFVLWHVNLRGLFNAKSILVEEQYSYHLTHRWSDEEINAFPMSISLKVNVIAWLEFEFVYTNVAFSTLAILSLRLTPESSVWKISRVENYWNWKKKN